MSNISSNLVSTKVSESYEIKIPNNSTIEEIEDLLEHLVRFSVLSTGAEENEIREHIQRIDNHFVFVVAETIVGNNLHPAMFDNIIKID